MISTLCTVVCQAQSQLTRFVSIRCVKQVYLTKMGSNAMQDVLLPYIILYVTCNIYLEELPMYRPAECSSESLKTEFLGLIRGALTINCI
jgi:hypothetical protein